MHRYNLLCIGHAYIQYNYVYVHIAMHCLCTWCAVYCNSPVSIHNISETVEYPFSGQFLKEHDVPFLGTDKLQLQHETMQANISDNIFQYKCLLQYTYTGLLIDRTPLAYVSLWARSLSSVTHTFTCINTIMYTHTPAHTDHIRVHTHIHTCTLICTSASAVVNVEFWTFLSPNFWMLKAATLNPSHGGICWLSNTVSSRSMTTACSFIPLWPQSTVVVSSSVWLKVLSTARWATYIAITNGNCCLYMSSLCMLEATV